MASLQADVALLTERRYSAASAAADDWYLQNILHDDRLLQAALAQRGISSIRIDWSRPDVDWSAFHCAVFRTTWDYFDRFAEFAAWLDVVQAQTRLCNDLELVRWNMDKHYLADLEARGVSVVQSRFLERGTAVRFSDLLDDSGWADAVVKPCVSGAARHTYRVDRSNASTIDAIIQPLLAEESFLIQPFEPEVMRSGEDSLMLFDGRYSHAVRKLPKAGDFRVQDDHGGTVHDYQPTALQIELAEQAMAACRPRPAYGRVDMITNSEGRLAVMELELIEPELWLRHHPPAAVAFADAVMRATGLESRSQESGAARIPPT